MFVGRRTQTGLDAGVARGESHLGRTARRTATGHLRGTAAALLSVCALVALAALATAGPAAAQTAPEILVFHDGSDATTDAGIVAIQDLGTENGFGVTVSDDPADFTSANLEQYAAVAFLDADGDVLPETSQENALRAYVQDGHGFLGIGSTADAEQDSDFFDGLVGARPAEPCPPEPEPGQVCSPTETGPQTVVFGDRVHPATRELPLMLDRTDEWYRWNDRPTGEVHTVARWHAPDDPAGDGTDVGGTDHPVSWCRDFQGGRSFYTAMGRTEGSYGEAEVQQHLLGAIQWTAGLVRANCKATISSNYEGERLVDASTGDLSHSGESHGLTVAPNGWVIYIGRGDCRTNQQRGEVAGTGPTDRILDFDDPNVGVGCGNVHIFDPAEHDGTVNSGATLAGIIPVYGDRGGGSEINGKIEAGLLGITLAPDFMETGHIYVQYFPTFNPDNPNHPGLADGADRRRTKMHHPRISRFTIDLETKELDLSSEVVIFEYESQIYSCCHRGGGMGFDSEGNLYFTTGDSNSSGGTGGYSGNNPPPKCPMRDPGDPDQESANNEDCGELNYSYQDARRTAGSTNDYNGKMIRFNPIDEIPDGEQPEVGIGTTYELPTADSPNGSNLFDGAEGDGDQAKPEIYAMGLRNPSRLAIDPETDIPYAAWVGPDAGSPNQQQGPSTYESASQIPQAGNYGWPYCMGNQQAYRDRVADGSLRTTNEAGFVSGGAAGSPIQGFYDCSDIVNNSPNNTGLEVLPHETGTGMDAGTARPLNVWYSRGNPGGANGCPEFPRPNEAPDYGAAPEQLCPYLTASGATVFTGPVYRYDEETADPSVAWPEYWDGRWFLHDFGNNSAKHALLLDPETDQAGSQPIYADSLRGNGGLNLNWQANYMDSKFAPDGSYYVQVYQGFFTTGAQAGLYRFTYNGGGPTPGADPQWEATGNPLEVQFSNGASGGVAWEWDFDNDGTVDSTEADPLHTYEADGPHEVTLTVTYADDQTDSKTITVNPQGDDTAAPTTTVQLNGADPVPSYDGPVEVTLTGDDAGGTGVEVTRYSVDGGAFTDYADPFTVSGDGEHTIEYRSRDAAGNVEETQSVTFTIETVGGGGDCLPQSDEFDGIDLDAKWDVLREVAEDPPVVADGSVTLPLRQGDFIANDPLAENVLLQDAPGGEWTATTALNIGDINGPGEQAGLVIWKSESPNTFSKIVFIQANSGQRQFEHIVTQEGNVDPGIPQSITPAPAGLPTNGTVLLRARYDGDSVTAEFSADDGATWTLIGQEGHEAPLAAPLRVGLTAFRGSSGEGNASFDWFRVHEGSAAGGPIGCGGGGDSCDEFEGTEIDPKWEIVNPSATNPPTISDDHLNMPIIQGDLFGGNGTAQMLLQGVPTDESWVLTAKIEHAAIDTNGEAAGLALVNRFDPNHFAKTALQFKNDTDPDTGGDQPGVWAERVLTAESEAVILPPETVPFPNSGALDLAGDYGWVRFVHDAGAQEIGTWTSTDGETFVDFGQNMPVDEYLSEPGGLRAGVFAKHDGTGDDVVRIDAFNVVIGSADPQTPGDECDGGGGGDNTAPTTTATTDPADPDGDNGWFLGDVEVTLDATDNAGGSGVDATEYSVDGGAFQPYSAPFTVTGEGQHTVEYRSTDVEGNVEATKSLDLKIDSTPPETIATTEGDGPFEVTLEADDGEGSGVAKTEFSVDGGPFQEYVSEQTILNSAADLESWAQAGPGGLEWMDDPEGGFARTVGGLGMPWYPVREFGDFSLKMQWRDSSTGTSGNSGVFVRFPDPRIPLADRPNTGPGDWDGEYCGRTGSAATQPAWVAIYCGQEIQINDYQSDTQKTGSIYNFLPVEDPDHMPDPRGDWVDYEIRVEGQQYTVIRNGTILSEFDNSIPLESIRGGDPPTDARQFSSGYIGLQNHGGSDVIDFRNVSILPLDDGTVEGPIVIDGDGATVEFRSTDAAGNVEETQEITVGDVGEPDLRTRVAPRRETVKLGKKAKFEFTVRNRGDVAAQDVELCVKGPKGKVRILGNDCRETPTLGKRQAVDATFRVKPKRSAAGDRIRLRFVATADNAGRASETATLKVKKKKKGRR